MPGIQGATGGRRERAAFRPRSGLTDPEVAAAWTEGGTLLVCDQASQGAEPLARVETRSQSEGHGKNVQQAREMGDVQRGI